MGPFLFNDLSTFLTFIGLSSFFNLKSCFLANSKLITNPVTPLSNSASTIIPSYVSILSNPIFTVTSLNVFSPTFLTFISFLVPSDSDISAFISVANILNLLQELSQGLLSSPPLLNILFVQCCPQIFLHLFLLSSSLFPCSYNDGPCAQNLHRHNSSSPYLSP